MMKVVGVSNFNLETMSDFLAAENVPNEPLAQCMADALNVRFGGESAPRHYVVKPSSYTLYEFEP